MSQLDYDVGIVGGGPAGSAAASYLSAAGLTCAIFERDLFPRPHVGESLVPAATRVFKEIDFLETLENAGFPRKFGAAWTSADKAPVYDMGWEGLEADCHVDIRFDERAQAGVDRNHTFHVDRGKFDLMLLQHASRKGAHVLAGARVHHIDFSDACATLRFQLGSQNVGVRVKMVIDASGRQTLLGNQLRVKVNDDVFDQYALHTWFEGYDRKRLARDSSQNDFIFIHFLPVTNTWVWQIPISESVTSIGVVTQKTNFSRRPQERESFFWECLKSRPELYDGLQAAHRIRPLREEGDYSYAMRQICGDRFVMVGDAARFVDPIFSSGVSIALNTARLASQDVICAFESGDFSRQAFASYEALQRRGTKNWYEFISVYYRLNVLFTAFVKNRRYRLDVLKLLQGDMYDEDEPTVLQEMKRIVTEVEQNDKHLWHQFLGNLTSHAFCPIF